MGKSKTITNLGDETLITEQELINYLDHYEKEADQLLQEALNTHRNFIKPGIPYIVWIILAFFAYDDILVYIQSPILFYPLLFIGIIFLLLIALVGLRPVTHGFIPMTRLFINMGLRMAGLRF